MMKQCFSSIVDKEFTANLEYLLDKVGDGTVEWKTVISNFYPDLEEAVNRAKEELESVTIADEVIWKKSAFPVRNAEKTLWLKRQKKDAGSSAVKIIRTVTLCPGRSPQPRNARNAKAIW